MSMTTNFEDDYDEEEDDYDRPSRSRGRSGRSTSRSRASGGGGSWEKVRVGAQIIAISTIVVAATHGVDLILTLVGQLMSSSMRMSASDFQGMTFQERVERQREIVDQMRSRGDTLRFLNTIQKVRTLIACLAFIPLIVGAVFVMLAPKGAVKGLGIAALSCFSLALVFLFIHSLRRFGTGPSSFPNVGLSVVYIGEAGRGVLTMLMSAVVAAGFILSCFALGSATTSKRNGPSGFCSVAAYVGIGHFGLILLADILGLAASMTSGWMTTMKTFSWISNIYFAAVVGLYIKAFFSSKNAL